MRFRPTQVHVPNRLLIFAGLMLNRNELPERADEAARRRFFAGAA
jgi:hypothetical protein